MCILFGENMLSPLVIRNADTLIIADKAFFNFIGDLNVEEEMLEVNVKSNGSAGFEWILDAEGNFFELKSIGLMKLTLLQRVGIKRRRERFKILPYKGITAGELLQRIEPLIDHNMEAPNVLDLKSFLKQLPNDVIMGTEQMKIYLGE